MRRPGGDDIESIGGPAALRSRTAASVVLLALVTFVGLQSYYDSAALAQLVPVFAIIGGTAAAVLAASYTRFRDSQTLAAVCLLGVEAGVLWGIAVAPVYTVLAAFGLACTLVGAPVFFGWGTAAVAALCAVTWSGFALVGLLSRSPQPDDTRRLLFSLAMILISSTIAVAGARVLERFRRFLAGRQEELAALSARLMSVQEDERRRLSRELHDELGGTLTALSAYLWLIEQNIPDGADSLHRHTTDARHLASETLAHVRALSQLLRPSVLDDLGLVPSLDSHLDAFAARHEIATHLVADGLPERLPAEIETAVFRIAQEALTNVARHSRARHVHVTLAVEGDVLRLEVQDDGVGLPDTPRARKGGMGLVGIRERVRALGGTLTLGSERGTRLTVLIPLPAGADDPAD